FWYTRQQIARQLAVRAYCLEVLGIGYGEREARWWGRRDFGIGSRLRNAILNRRVFNFLDGDLELLAKELVSYRPSYIYGYSSMVLRAAQHFDQSKSKPPALKAIICT